jgi:2-methylcitrate dehydratase PrpD
MEQTDKVVQFIQGLRWSDIPGAVKHQAKRCLLDTLGALLAGTRTPVAGITAEMAVEQFPGNGATILGRGQRVSMVGAAMANGFAANGLDIDDGYRRIKGHPGACVLPLVLAAGEVAGCSGAEFLTAMILGYEVGIRAGLIRHATYEVYHSSGSWGAIAGAAAAGRIMGLDASTLREAMGIAEYHAPIAPMMKGIEKPSMGKDSIGWGCMVAMSSLLMAQKSFTGVRPLFDDVPEESWITGLGQQYEIMNLYFKPYCACRWAQPAVDGALVICQREELTPDQIESIEVRTFAEAAALSRAHPRNTEDAQYNLAFPIAAALIDGAVGPEQVLPPRLRDPDLRAMMDRVLVCVEESYQREFPARALAEVIIETDSAQRFSSGAMSASWDPASRLPTDDELVDKYHWLVDPLLGASRASEVESMVWQFEKHGPAELINSTSF